MTTIPYIPSVKTPVEKEKDADPEMLAEAVGLKDDHGYEIYDRSRTNYYSLKSNSAIVLFTEPPSTY